MFIWHHRYQKNSFSGGMVFRFWQLYYTISSEGLFIFEQQKMVYLCGLWRFANAYSDIYLKGDFHE